MTPPDLIHTMQRGLIAEAVWAYACCLYETDNPNGTELDNASSALILLAVMNRNKIRKAAAA